jgi:hypothetical protein
MKPKPSYITLTSTQQAELTSVVPSSGWKIISGKDLPTVFPHTFRNKIDSALVISQPTSTGGTYLVLSARRVDKKANAIDLEPFAIIVHSTGTGRTGVFLHHGSWEGRTEQLPEDFLDEASRSGIGDYFLSKPPNAATQGTIDQLPKGDRGAFDAAVKAIRAHEDTASEQRNK